jgi:hypothetical protein
MIWCGGVAADEGNTGRCRPRPDYCAVDVGAARGTSRGTEVRETQITSEHPSMPEIRPSRANRLVASHCPKVAGFESRPRYSTKPLHSRGFRVLRQVGGN